MTARAAIAQSLTLRQYVALPGNQRPWTSPATEAGAHRADSGAAQQGAHNNMRYFHGLPRIRPALVVAWRFSM